MVRAAYATFLSHNSADKPAVEEIARRLTEKGVSAWLDKWQLRPGGAWQRDIEEGLDSSKTCCVFIGPSGLGPWQDEEMRAAIDESVNNRDDFRVIPVLLPGTQRPERGDLPKFLVRNTWVEFRKSLKEDDAFNRLVWGISGKEPPLPDVDPSVCPYRGLEPFEEQHADFFEGREALTEWLLDDLRKKAASETGNRFLALVGASGSGKSSLAMAGLVPPLKKGVLEGSEHWPIMICRPGNEPLQNLAMATKATIGEPPEQILKGLENGDKRTLHLKIGAALSSLGRNCRAVLLVDQFEELFTECSDEDTRQRFLNNLLYASSVPRGRTLVVITLRADFYAHCGKYPELATTISANQELVRAMDDAEVRQAIERPAYRVGCEFEPGLVEILVKDFHDQAGALPLLQHALQQLWIKCCEENKQREFTTTEYRQLGGLEGALDKHADGIYEGLESAELQNACRSVLLRLVRIGETPDDTTRRRARISDLLGGDGEIVIQRLATARLLTTYEGPEKTSLVEITHEALIRGWSRLRQWISTNRDDIKTFNQLASGAVEWARHEENPDYLFTGARLANAEELQSREDIHGIALGETEHRFLESSIEARDRQRREKELLLQAKVEAAERIAQQQRELAEEKERLAEEQTLRVATEQRRVKQVSIVAGVAAGLFLLAVAASVFWYAERGKARTAQTKAETAQHAAVLAKTIAEDRFSEAKEAISLASKISDSAEKYRSNSEALEDYEKLQTLLAKLPKDVDVQAALGNVYNAIGSIYVRQQDYASAIERYDAGLSLRGAIAAERGEYKRKYANAHMNKAQAEYALGMQKRTSRLPDERKQVAVHFANAREGFVTAQRIREELRDGAPLDPDWEGLPLDGALKVIRDLASGYYALGNLDFVEGKYEAALASFLKALPAAKAVREAESDPDNERLLGNILTRLGETKKRQGELGEAEDHLQAAEEVLLPLANANPDVDEYQRDLALLYHARASLRYESKEFLQAAAYREKQVQIFKTLTARRSADPQFHDDLGKAHIGLVYARYQLASTGKIKPEEFVSAEQDTKRYIRELDERFNVRQLYYAFCQFYTEMARLHQQDGADQKAKGLLNRQAKFIEELVSLHPNDPFYKQLPSLPGVKIESGESAAPRPTRPPDD